MGLRHKEEIHSMALYPDLVIALVHWMMVDIIGYYAGYYAGGDRRDSQLKHF